MSAYTATFRWSREGAEGFTKGQYSRAHEWAFGGDAPDAAKVADLRRRAHEACFIANSVKTEVRSSIKPSS